ncbi:MAG: CoA pyrophosphatase [Planctomycetota bacterium]
MILDDDAIRSRLLRAPSGWPPTSSRLAAVLAPLFRRSGEEHLLLIARPRHLAQHPGQIGFPGGMREGDESPIDCALREYREELGLPTDGIRILGALPSRDSSTGIHVHALVARVPEPRGYALAEQEVERVLEVPLEDLRNERRWRVAAHPRFPGPSSPHFRIAGDLIWGLTGRFCADLVAVLRDL